MKQEGGRSLYQMITASRLTAFAAALAVLIALAAFGSLQSPRPAFADDAKFYLDCPQNQVREGESVDVFLVRQTSHQHDVGFHAYWHTEADTVHSLFDLHSQDNERQDATSEEIASNRMRHTVKTRQDQALEREEYFTVSFTPLANVVDPDDPELDNQCQIAIVDDDLSITGIEMVSSPSLWGAYGLGETIEFATTFSHQVEVQGGVAMGLWIGEDWRGATYLSGSGSDRLVFGYEVQPDDFDGDGVSVHSGYVEDDGTRHGIGGSGVIIEPDSGAQASPWYEGLWQQSAHEVKGSRAPRPMRAEFDYPDDKVIFLAGEKILLAIQFSAPVRALNYPLASFWFDGTGESQWKGAKYESGSGTDTLKFSYLVQPGDLDNDGLMLGGKGEQGFGEGKIMALNHDVSAVHKHKEWQTDLKVNGNIEVTDVSIVSSPASGDTYRYGESIEVDVTFNVPVRALNNPVASLWFDGTETSFWKGAQYQSGSGTETLRFSYKVGTDDRDTDGILIGAIDSQGLGEGKVKALDHDWDADHTYGAQHLEGHKVNGKIEVTDVSIISSPASGDTYRYGESIEVDVTFSAPVRALNNPVASLWFDGTETSFWKGAQYQSGSGTETLRFSYKVGTEDRDADGILIGAIDSQGLGEGKVRALDPDGDADHFYGAQHLEGHKVNGQPYVKDVAVTSIPAFGDGIYGQGEIIEIAVTFDQAVEKEGEVKIELGFLAGDYVRLRHAQYESGDGTDTFVFQYEVATDDYDEGGLSIYFTGESSGFAGTGAIKAMGSDVELDPAYPSQYDVEGQGVNGGSLIRDTSAPRINSVSIITGPEEDGTYAAGDRIVVAVTFNEPVSVFGIPQLGLDIGDEQKTAEFWDRSFTGRDITRDADRMGMEPTILLAYTVQEGDLDSDGVSIGANALSLNDGTIWDKIGNHADLSHETVPADAAHRVDAPDLTAPWVSSISISSDPGADSVYAIGDQIAVSVTFSEDISVEESPQLELDIGGEARFAEFENSEGATVVFSYGVAEGDDAPDGIAIDEGAMSLGDGSIQDAAGNDAELAHEAIPADEGHLVDGVRPAFSSAEVSEDGTAVTVNFSEDVTLSSMLQLLGDAINIQQGTFLRAFVTLSVDGEGMIASSAGLSDSALTLSLADEVAEGQEVTVSFENIFADDGVPIFIDGAGNAMADFDSQPVVNLSTAPEVAYSMAGAEAGATDVVLSDTLLELEEGESATYTVALSSQPSEDVSVVITRTPLSGTDNAPLALPFLTMYFTSENWNVPQDVTIEAEADEDANNHVVFLTHTAHGGGYYLETKEMRVVIRDTDG